MATRIEGGELDSLFCDSNMRGFCELEVHIILTCWLRCMSSFRGGRLQ